MASGDTKTEAMLNVLGNGGTGDEFRGCCNTKTQQYILDAIDRINKLDPGGGGTSDFNELDNRPMYNGEPMTGETNIPQGVNSLFLNRGSGATEYSILADSAEEKQLCKIINDYISGDNKSFLISFADDNSSVSYTSTSIRVISPLTNVVQISFNVEANKLSGTGSREYGITYKNLGYSTLFVRVSRTEYDNNNVQHVFSNDALTERRFILTSVYGEGAWAIQDSSISTGPLGTTNTTAYTPTQNYHPATKKYVDDKILTGAGAPTTATVGVVGQLYEDSTNGKLYQCTAVSGDTYTWTEVGAGGGGGAKELTIADYNYDSDNDGTNDCVALWLLDPGLYYVNNPYVSGPNVVQVRRYRDDSYGFYYYNAFLITPQVQSPGLINIYEFGRDDALFLICAVDIANGYRSGSDKAFATKRSVDELSYLIVGQNHYNYPSSNPDGLALWQGIYDSSIGDMKYKLRFDEHQKVYFNSSDAPLTNVYGYVEITFDNTGLENIPTFKFTDMGNGDIYIGETQHDGTKVSLKKIAGTNL